MHPLSVIQRRASSSVAISRVSRPVDILDAVLAGEGVGLAVVDHLDRLVLVKLQTWISIQPRS